MLSDIVQELGLTVLTVEHRVKAEKSLAGKLERSGDYYNVFEDLTDILGCRIVCFLSDPLFLNVLLSPLAFLWVNGTVLAFCSSL